MEPEAGGPEWGSFEGLLVEQRLNEAGTQPAVQLPQIICI